MPGQVKEGINIFYKYAMILEFCQLFGIILFFKRLQIIFQYICCLLQAFTQISKQYFVD